MRVDHTISLRQNGDSCHHSTPLRTSSRHSEWSATTDADNPSNVWFVFFNHGSVDGVNKTLSVHAWCVRGGMHADAY